MKALDLFSGIGGISLAAEWAGIETIAFCEIEPFCQKVLQKHWPDVPIFDDVRKLNRQSLEEGGVDVGAIELISAGYPCQPFSTAGKRQGERDDRHLWPEVYRLLKEINPPWFLGENVAGHVSLGLDQVLSDLESINYAWEAFVIPACGVNAPHRRYRVFIVARNAEGYDIGTLRGIQKRADTNAGGICEDVADSERIQNIERHHSNVQRRRESQAEQIRLGGSDVSDTDIEGLPQRNGSGSARTAAAGIIQGSKFIRAFTADGRKQWDVEPKVGRVANGVPDRVDQLRALGNAVVPQQIYPILAAIAEIEGVI